MTTHVRTVNADADAAAAAMAMWEADCGVVPVIGFEGSVAGVVTDRDICMGALLSHRRESDLRVRDVMSKHVYACLPEDDVQTALATMREKHVRRLPVIDGAGHLVGLLSLNDIVLHVGNGGPTPKQVIEALKSICAHRTVQAV
jgi:CBS domain-containing protein